MPPAIEWQAFSLIAALHRAHRLTDREYATTKLIHLNLDNLKPENTVSVSFSDSTDGVVGSVVIRAAVTQDATGRR